MSEPTAPPPPPSDITAEDTSEDSGLIALVVHRPVATWMMAIALAVFGLVSLWRLPLDLMPTLTYPTLTVRTEVPGYAPQEVESQISRPIEEALATTEGLVELESRSRAGVSDVVLEFDWGTSMDQATQGVRERLQTTFLVEDASRPLILRFDPSQEPILRIALAVDASSPGAPQGEQALYLLRELAERVLKRELEALDGVAAVRVRGGLERELRVELRQDWMAARGVSVDQVVAALGAENINLPGGSIREGDQEYLVRTLNELATVEEVRAIQVRSSSGVAVPIGEVARVSEAHRDREVLSRLDGAEAVELEVFKAADANIVRVANAVQRSLGAAEEAGLVGQLPAGVKLVVLQNQAKFVESALANVQSSAWQGSLLSVIIIYFFLRSWRPTAIIALSIPLSVIATFAAMELGGVSLNLMSLGGLALGVGMVVDNSIVVLENIEVVREAGLRGKAAAIVGARQMAAAVIASTMTSVAVFLPIVFVEGVAGQVFGDLALAVVFSLLASLVVSLLFVPVLAATEVSMPAARPLAREVSRAARFASWPQLKQALLELRSAQSQRPLPLRWAWRALVAPLLLGRFALRLGLELLAALAVFGTALPLRLFMWAIWPLSSRGAAWVQRLTERLYQRYVRLSEGYERLLRAALVRPGTVLGAAAALTLLSWPVGQGLGQTLLPEAHQGRFTVELALPVGTPLGRTAELVEQLEERVFQMEGVQHLHAVVGSERRADSRADEGEHSARLLVELSPGGDLETREQALMERVRGAALEVAEGRALDLRLSSPSIFSTSTPLEIVVWGNDLEQLREEGELVRSSLQGVAGLDDVRSSLGRGSPELRITYDRILLERMGLDTGSLARRVRDQLQGSEATSITRGDGRLDLIVRLSEEERRSLADVRRINVNPALMPPVPLESVARFEEGEGPSEIRRIDQRRAVVVSANVEGFDVGGARARAESALAGASGDWEVAGQSRELDRSTDSMLKALLLALFLVYVVMAATFESVVQPLVILFSVPLAGIGVVGILWLTGTPISAMVLLGAIVLAGVVVNNAIVLVDTINRLRSGGADRLNAIASACALRLRPIMSTALTTIIGVVPLAMGLGDGAEIQQPLALTLMAGLSSSTLLTLGVIPVVYERVTQWLEGSPEARAEVQP